VGVGAAVVGFAVAVGRATRALGADAEGLAFWVGLGRSVVDASDATGVGELATAGGGDEAIPDGEAKSVGDAASDAGAADVAATLAGVGIIAACLVDVEQATSAKRAAIASTNHARWPVAPVSVLRGMAPC
jgi:hypothetical protein